MTRPILIRPGEVKIWVHDVTSLPFVMAAFRVQLVLPPAVGALHMFLDVTLGRLHTAGHRCANLEQVAFQLRGAGWRNLANRVGRLNAAAATLRHATQQTILDTISEVKTEFGSTDLAATRADVTAEPEPDDCSSDAFD